MRSRLAQLGVAALALALAACNTPVPSIRIVPAGMPTQACPCPDPKQGCTTSVCTAVPLMCPTVMSIAIYDPKDPTTPLLKQCSAVPFNSKRDLCAVAQVDLDPTPLPVRELDVQIALFPASAATVDSTGMLCPDVQFSVAGGFPIEQAPAPALGGRTFYHPGDTVVTVALGCTDLELVNSCVEQLIDVSANVSAFPTGGEVTTTTATTDNLVAAVGEPHPVGSVYMISDSDTTSLKLSNDSGIAKWTGQIAASQIVHHICVDVLERAAATTATLTCIAPNATRPLMLTGAWLTTQRLNEFLAAIRAPAVPAQGLTIGLVLDPSMTPVAGATVTTGPGSNAGRVRYLTAAGRDDGLATSDSGVFVSTDAPFGTEFTAHAPGFTDVIGIGGLVSGRITIVVVMLEAGT